MRLLFTPVNYNSYDSLNDYISAIYHALKNTDGNHIEADILVADNSPEPQALRCDDHIEGLVIKVFHYFLHGYDRIGGESVKLGYLFERTFIAFSFFASV